METKRITTHSAEETRNYASSFAKSFLKKPFHDSACIVNLVGDLGAGKTTFAKGFAAGLGIIKIITSPTFLLVKTYHLSDNHFTLFYHIDAYRLSESAELFQLGFENWKADPHAIILIEWGDTVSDILPARRIDIQFRTISENERELTIHDFFSQ